MFFSSGCCEFPDSLARTSPRGCVSVSPWKGETEVWVISWWSTYPLRCMYIYIYIYTMYIQWCFLSKILCIYDIYMYIYIYTCKIDVNVLYLHLLCIYVYIYILHIKYHRLHQLSSTSTIALHYMRLHSTFHCTMYMSWHVISCPFHYMIYIQTDRQRGKQTDVHARINPFIHVSSFYFSFLPSMRTFI